MLRDDAALLDILKAARLACEFVADVDRAAFLRDAKTQSAVLHQLTVVGEAVKRLSEEFRAEHARLPWKAVAGMRDKLIHDYDEVDLEEVWKTLKADLPQLIAEVERLSPG